MILDIFTLIIILGLTDFLQMIAILYLYLNNRSEQGIDLWVYGFASVAIGFLLLILREYIKADLISVILANTLLNLGAMLIYAGILRFFGSRANKALITVIFSLFITSFFYFTFIRNDINIRTNITSLIIAVFSYLTAYALIFIKPKYALSAVKYLSAIFIVHGSFYLFRLIINLTVSPVYDLLNNSLIQVFTFLFQIIEGIFLTFALIFLVNQKRNNEIKESKEHFELLFNTGPDPAIITRLADGYILHVNEGFYEVTGYSREDIYNETSLNMNLWKYPEERKKVVEILKQKGSCNNFEAIFIRKNGSELDGLISAKLINIFDTDAIITVVRDITYKKKLEKELLNTNAELEKKVIERTKDLENKIREQEDFTYSMSHDLKSPLRSINSFSKILYREYYDKVNEEGKRLLSKIATESLNISRLIDALLELFRINQSVVIRENVNLSEIALDSINEFKEKYTDKTITPVIKGDLYDHADQKMIKILIDNLISNAFKFSPDENELVIEFSIKTINNEKVYFIRDNGIGFNIKYADKIFGTFNRLDVTDKYPGTGIGLAIAKRIIQHHNGRIWVESDEGTGSVFYFTLN